jgi:hypothetical protein
MMRSKGRDKPPRTLDGVQGRIGGRRALSGSERQQVKVARQDKGSARLATCATCCVVPPARRFLINSVGARVTRLCPPRKSTVSDLVDSKCAGRCEGKAG